MEGRFGSSTLISLLVLLLLLPSPSKIQDSWEELCNSSDCVVYAREKTKYARCADAEDDVWKGFLAKFLA
jgi:hypothetical protein